MPVNQDYKDLFKILYEEKVEYLIVGAHAVIFYTEPRYTRDIDLWVNPAKENVNKLWSALIKFGAPLVDIKKEEFLDQDLIYQIGIEPNRIDIIMGMEHIPFSDVYPKKSKSFYDGVPINIISRSDLIKTKENTGRKKDELDIESLKEFS